MPTGRIAFRPLTRDDFPLLATWLAEPHVAAWWREPADPASIEQRYGPGVDGTDPTRLYVITEDGRPVGLIQCYRHADEPAWDRAVGIPAAAGIDYLIGESDRLGRGLGSRAIAAFSTAVFDRYPEVDVIVAAPQADNVASCRALAKAGYTLTGVRDLESDDPGDDGPSAVYLLARRAHRPSSPLTGHINSSG